MFALDRMLAVVCFERARDLVLVLCAEMLLLGNKKAAKRNASSSAVIPMLSSILVFDGIDPCPRQVDR